MKTKLNREKLITYIRKNKPEHLRAKINAYSDIQLIMLKVGIELENSKRNTKMKEQNDKTKCRINN